MNEIYEFFGKLFSASSWPARWHCGRWTSFHGGLYIASSILIALAYFSIPLIFYYLIRKAKDKLPFQKIFWLFLLFILACGFTHVFDALMFWYPVYRVSAIVLFLTALVSWMAVIGLYKVIPGALTLKSPAMLEDIITERTLQLAQINEHLRKTNLELNESKLATEKVLRQKDEFLSVASHELKTPITSLKGYTQLLSTMSGKLDHDTSQMCVKMDAQINKLTVLINDLLDVTKIQEGGLVYSIENMNLAETLLEITEEMQRTTATHQLVYEPAQDIFIHGDKNRISQVITNLLSNAIKYSVSNTKIIVRLSGENNLAVCSVQDFGLGIPRDQQEKVFEKFYRASGKNMHSYPGLGLGLHIVQEIIAKHRGKTWLESEEGKGSIFYFSLPMAN